MELYVIASRVGAEVFRRDSGGKFLKVKEISNPLGRLKNRSMRDDKPGRQRSRLAGSPPHSLTGEKSPHDQSLDQLVKSLTKYLSLQLKKSQSMSFRVAAEARLLGKLRTSSNSRDSDRITWIKKDIKGIPKSKWPNLLGVKPSERKRSVRSSAAG